jgi:hypothetical protein
MITVSLMVVVGFLVAVKEALENPMELIRQQP